MSKQKYSSVSIFLHWIVALFIFALLMSGWSLHNEWISSKQLIFKLYQWHKSIGVLALVLIAVRIVWRLKNKAPVVPKELKKDKKLINTGHIALYLLLIIMPLSGWALVSSNPKGIPTLVFGYFNWWHLPLSESSYTPSAFIHYYAAWVISVLVVGHIAMTIKHQLAGVDILQRMHPSKRIRACLVLVLALIALASINIFKDSASNTKPENSYQISTVQTAQKLGAKKGSIEFAGEHADNPFSGIFTQWKLNTDLNVEAKSIQQFDLTVNVDSATTGSTLYDSTLKESDWFDVANHPQATYSANSAAFINDTRIQLEGDFSIRGKTIPLSLVLNLELDTINNQHNIETSFTLKRSELGIGQGSDPDADWVSDEIHINATVGIK